MSETTIYCFIAGMWGDDFHVAAAYIDDDKLVELAGHVSSSVGFAKGDIGYTKSGMGDHKHKIYNEKFPDGYKLEWVDDLKNHPILKQFVMTEDELKREKEMEEIVIVDTNLHAYKVNQND